MIDLKGHALIAPTHESGSLGPWGHNADFESGLRKLWACQADGVSTDPIVLGITDAAFNIAPDFNAKAQIPQNAVAAGIALGLAVSVVLTSRAYPAPAALVHHCTPTVPENPKMSEPRVGCAPQVEHACCPLNG